jgi:hypothetical protein
MEPTLRRDEGEKKSAAGEQEKNNKIRSDSTESKARGSGEPRTLVAEPLVLGLIRAQRPKTALIRAELGVFELGKPQEAPEMGSPELEMGVLERRKDQGIILARMGGANKKGWDLGRR